MPDDLICGAGAACKYGNHRNPIAYALQKVGDGSIHPPRGGFSVFPNSLTQAKTIMPTLDFKGKQLIYAHHLTVASRPLEVDARKSLPIKGGKRKDL